MTICACSFALVCDRWKLANGLATFRHGHLAKEDEHDLGELNVASSREHPRFILAEFLLSNEVRCRVGAALLCFADPI